MRAGTSGILINYERCVACHQCIRSCCRAHDCDEEGAGIRVLPIGPYKHPDGQLHFDNMPIFTTACDFCHTFIGGKRNAPACVRTCPSRCLLYIDALSADAEDITLRTSYNEHACFCFFKR